MILNQDTQSLVINSSSEVSPSVMFQCLFFDVTSNDSAISSSHSCELFHRAVVFRNVNGEKLLLFPH